MPTINISGSGSSGQPDPKQDRGAAWGAYEAQRAAAQGAASKRESEVDRAYRQRDGDVLDKARQAASAWRGHDMAEAKRVRDESRLLSREETLEKRRSSNITATSRFVEQQRKLDVSAQRQFAKQQAAQRRQAGMEGSRAFNRMYADARDENAVFDARRRTAERAKREVERSERQAFARDYDDARREDDARSRRDPYVIAARQAAGVGGGSNWFERRLAKQRLDKIEARADKRMQGADAATIQKNQRIVDAAKESRAGIEAQEMLEGAGFLGKGGPAAFAAEMGWKGIKAIANAPSRILSVEQRLMAAAAPYNNQVMHASDIGTANGFSGSVLSEALLPKSGQPPAWMVSRGLTREGVMDLYQQYGIGNQFGNDANAVQNVKNLATMAADANRTPYLGGMGAGRYAESMGLVGNLIAPQGPNRLVGGQGYTMERYLSDLQRIQESAVEKGMNKAKVFSNLEGLLQQTATNGHGYIDPDKEMTFYNRLMTGGLPSMRDGSGILSAAAGVDAKIQGLGFGGDSLENTMYSQYFGRHGGFPKTQAALEKFLGKRRADMPAADQRAFDLSLHASQDNSPIGFLDNFKPLVDHPTQIAVANEVTGYYGSVPDYLRQPMFANSSGLGQAGALSYGTGGKFMPPPVGKGWAGVPTDEKNWILKYAQQDDVDPKMAASIIYQETGGTYSNFDKNGNVLRSKSGRLGLGQMGLPAYQDVQRSGLISSAISYEQAMADPELATEASIGYLKVRGSPEEYYGSNQTDKDTGMNKWVYGGQVRNRLTTYDNAGEVQNIVQSDSNVDQQAGQAARQPSALSQDIGSGAGQGLTVFSSKVADATTWLTHFAEAVGRATLNLTKTGGDPSRVNGPAPAMPPPGAHPVMPTNPSPPMKGY